MAHGRTGPPTAVMQIQFVTYCLLSLTAVAMFQCKPFGDANAISILIWGNIPIIVSGLFHIMNDIACIETNLHYQYIVGLSAILLGLGQIATWIPTHLAVERGTAAQAGAIHFALSYIVISESEFCRLCWMTHHGDRPLSFKSLVTAREEAMEDPYFKEFRDYFDYGIQGRYEFQHEENATFTRRFILYTSYGIKLWDFHILSACINHIVRLLANPNRQSDTFNLMLCNQVFFTPRRRIYLILDFLLQRPLRVLNVIFFWSVKIQVERAWDIWYN